MADINYSITRKTYEESAAQYARRQDRVWEKPFAQRITRLFADYLEPPARVLTLGCGAGQENRRLQQLGFDVVGLDLSLSLLEEARGKTDSPLVCGDGRALPFRPRSFDGVWAMASLLHIPRDQQTRVLTGLQEVLRPDGLLLCALKAGQGQQVRENEFGKRFFSYYQPDEYARLLERAGFQLEHSHVEPSESKKGEDFFVQMGRVGRRQTRPRNQR